MTLPTLESAMNTLENIARIDMREGRRHPPELTVTVTAGRSERARMYVVLDMTALAAFATPCQTPALAVSRMAERARDDGVRALQPKSDRLVVDVARW